MAKKGLRTVALAFQEMSPSEARAGIDGSVTPKGLTLLTLVGIRDPVRPEVPPPPHPGSKACVCVCVRVCACEVQSSKWQGFIPSLFLSAG